MPKNTSQNIDVSNFIPSFFLIAYLCIGFTPNLEAVDKIAPQWVAMTLLNLVSVSVFFYFKKSVNEVISKVVNSYLTLFYIGFIVWAGLSYFYAINSTEVLVNITRQVNVLLMFLSMAILLFNLKNKKVLSKNLLIYLSNLVQEILSNPLL